MKEIHAKFNILWFFFLRQTGNMRIFRSVEYDTMNARGVYKFA